MRQQLLRITVAVLFPTPADPLAANLAAYPDDIVPGALRCQLQPSQHLCLSITQYSMQRQANSCPVTAQAANVQPTTTVVLLRR